KRENNQLVCQLKGELLEHAILNPEFAMSNKFSIFQGNKYYGRIMTALKKDEKSIESARKKIKRLAKKMKKKDL
ncbi:MAG: hypothetical protein PHT91_02265, partial [Candidatus Nanoarchaeia archaeon]|nr:hypothetical protein [Candidatus Nanoarchaeia archaeon]